MLNLAGIPCLEKAWVSIKGCIKILDYARDKGVDFGMEAVITHLIHGYESVKKMFEVINRDAPYSTLVHITFI